MNHFPIFVFSTFATLTLAAGSQAQERRADYSVAFEAGAAGLEFGSSLTASHWARRTSLDGNGSYENQVGASCIERVKVWGVTREAKAVIGTYTVRHQRTEAGRLQTIVNSATGSLVVRLAGLTVYSSSANTTQTHEEILSPRQIYGSSGLAQSVSVAGYGITVRARVQAGADFQLTPTITLPSTLSGILGVSVRLSGMARGEVRGSASAAIDVPGVSAGVNSDLEFASARVDLDATATPTTASGSLTYLVRAITLRLSAYVTVYPPFLPPATFSTTLVNLTAAQRSGTIPLL